MSAVNSSQVLKLLDNITAKLASSSDETLSQVLDTVLLQLLQLLGFPDAEVRAKVMSLVNHVHQRVKSQPSIKLPTAKILSLFKKTLLLNGSAFIVNFSALYLRMSFEREPTETKNMMLHSLIENISVLKVEHQQTLLGIILLGIIEKYTNSCLQDEWKKEDLLFQFFKPCSSTSSANTIDNSESDVNVVFEQLRRLMLFPAGTTFATKTPPGLCIMDVRSILQLFGNKSQPQQIISSADMLPKKLAILKFFRCHFERCSQTSGREQCDDRARWLASRTLTMVLAATCDAHYEVVASADLLLRQFVDSAVDLNDINILHSLYDLILGTGKPETSADLQRCSAGEALQLKALSFVQRFHLAIWPETCDLLRLCFADVSEKRRLLSCGIQFVIGLLNSAKLDAEHLQFFADQILDMMLLALKTLPLAGRLELLNIRGSVYTSIGHLCPRCKVETVVHQHDLIAVFFQALVAENSFIRPAINEGLSRVSVCYWQMPNQLRSQVEKLLLHNARMADADICQRAALQCMNKLFPFSHLRSRFTCILLADHKTLTLREEALKGLNIRDFSASKQQWELLAMTACSSAARKEKETEKVEDASAYKKPQQSQNIVETFPNFSSFMELVEEHFKFKNLLLAADNQQITTISCSSNVLGVIARFSFSCLVATALNDERCVTGSGNALLHFASVGLQDTKQQFALDVFVSLLTTCLHVATHLMTGATPSKILTIEVKAVTSDDEIAIIPCILFSHVANSNLF